MVRITMPPIDSIHSPTPVAALYLGDAGEMQWSYRGGTRGMQPRFVGRRRVLGEEAVGVLAAVGDGVSVVELHGVVVGAQHVDVVASRVHIEPVVAEAPASAHLAHPRPVRRPDALARGSQDLHEEAAVLAGQGARAVDHILGGVVVLVNVVVELAAWGGGG